MFDFSETRVLVACVDTFQFMPRWHAESLSQFMYTAHDLISAGRIDVKREYHCVIDEARSKIAWDAAQPENGYTHLYFVDGDMEFTLDHLIALLERKVDVVSGTYFMRGHKVMDGKPREEFPCVGTRDGKYITRKEIKEAAEKNQLIPVHGVGGGSLLVTSEALRAIGQPAFKFNWHIGGSYMQHSGEDQWFSVQARTAGYDVWMDPCVIPMHYGFVHVGFDICDGNGFSFHTPSY
jgi:hypothetical protein